MSRLSKNQIICEWNDHTKKWISSLPDEENYSYP